MAVNVDYLIKDYHPSSAQPVTIPGANADVRPPGRNTFTHVQNETITARGMFRDFLA